MWQSKLNDTRCLMTQSNIKMVYLSACLVQQPIRLVPDNTASTVTTAVTGSLPPPADTQQQQQTPPNRSN
uniref:Uncharacterized protein n=1 Tax=Anopheles christyi TaxID=43041 RepID=A0A182JQ85_9DIPT